MSKTSQMESAAITAWFHRRVCGISPAMAIREVMDRFVAALKRRRHCIAVNEKQLRLSMCEALCTMRSAHKLDRKWGGPWRTFPSPAGWNNDYDGLWDDWVRSRCYNDEFWESFWQQIPEEAWESDVPAWRANIQWLLPLYVLPDMQSLVKDNVISVEDEQGQEYVSTHHHNESYVDDYY
jgi:hypothetical protein